ncbi:MAG: BatD family protein, partial [Ferruginibacter sp.]
MLFCFLFCCFTSEAQVRFSASLTPPVISEDDFTTIRFELENADNIQNITPPSFSHFILISGPFQESGMTNINGKVTNHFSISFVIKPKNRGSFKILPAAAKINGKTFYSNQVILTVTKSTGIPRSVQPFTTNRFFEQRPLSTFNDYIFKEGENVAEKVNKNMHLRLEVNKTSCYIGEPVIATYKLYTRLKSESKLTQNPSFNGFSVVDLQAPDVTVSAIDKFKGREYHVYTIRKAQLYPLQAGKIELESAELENKIQFIKESYAKTNEDIFSDVFEDFANASVSPEAVIDQTVILKSKPVSIEVKPLPENGKPAIFKGAVGQFEIETSLEVQGFSADKSGKLIVMISG